MTGVLATFVDFRTIRTRSAAQIVLEIPIEQADAALKALGGIPQPATERWVGVALAPKERAAETKKDKRAWDQLSPTEQAGIRCAEPQFWSLLEKRVGGPAIPLNTAENAAEYVRRVCKIQSRSELNTNEAAANRWRQLELQYQTWLTDRRYAESRR